MRENERRKSMKKILLCLLVLVMTLCTAVACVSEDEEKPSAPTYEAPDYGRATVYAPGDSVLLITSEMNDDVLRVKDAIDELVKWNGYGGVTSGTIYNQNQKLEILFNVQLEDESRPIINTAEKYLERVDKESYFEARYVIYADSGKIAICFDENAYTNLQATKYVVDSFLEKYVSGRQYVALPAGVVESGIIDLKALQEEIDIEYTANQWVVFESAAKAKFGDEAGARIIDAFRTYYSMIDDRVVGWWANMYDPGIGGFYGTSSGRDHLGYLPNIEGTDQILNHFSTSGMLDTLGGSVTENLPDLMVHQLIYYYKSLQNPTDKYFYNPQLGVAGTSTYRLGRDQGRCTGRLVSLGSRPTYDHVNGTKGDGITADQYWDMMVEAGEISPDTPRPYVPKSLEDYENYLNGDKVTESLSASADVAVSKIILAASDSAADSFANHENFNNWLQKYADIIDTNPYSGCSNINATYKTIEGNAKIVGKYTEDESKWYYGMDYCEMVIKVLNDHINGRGLFGKYDTNSTDPSAGCKYANTNGLMKAIPIYSAWGIAYPKPLEAVEGCLIGIMSDEKSTSNICETYNIWEALSGVLNNVRKFGTEQQKQELLGYTDSKGVYHPGTVELALGEFGPEAVVNTYEKQKNYQTSEGGFSHSVTSGVTENGGCPIGLGLKENNVDANGFGMQSVINAMASCFGLRDYRPALFTESDWMEFLDIVLELQPVIKYSYDEMDGTSSIDKVFTFDEELPAKGLTVSSSVNFPNNKYSWASGVGKDGENGILRLNKTTTGSGSSMSVIANANVKATGATLATFEFDIKYSNVTSKSESQIQVGTLSKTSMREMPIFILLTFGGTADGSKVYYSDYNNGTSNQQNIDTGAVVGEWFTVKVEYYSGDMNTFRFRTYINDKLIYTSNSIYSQKINSTVDPLPAATEIQRATISFNEAFKGTFELDNISLIQSRGTLEGEVGVGKPGEEVMPDEKPDGPPESVPDTIPEGITTPAADDAVTFDYIPVKQITEITSADFLNVYYLVDDISGNKVLYIDKRSYLDSNSGVIFRQKPTKTEENATIAIFEGDYYISGYDQIEVIQFTATGKTAGNAFSPYMMLLKAKAKDRGSMLQFVSYKYDAEQGKSVGGAWIDTPAKVGEWFRVRIEYEATNTSSAGLVTGIKYRMFINNQLIKEMTDINGASLAPNGGTGEVPSAADLTQFNFSFNASTKGRFAIDNLSFRKLAVNDYKSDELVIPDPIVGSGFDEPAGAITFKENFEDMVAAGTIKVDTKDVEGNTYSVVTERGDKMLGLVKTDNSKQEIFHHYVKDKAGSYDFVAYEAVLKYAPAEGQTNGNMEIAFLDEAGEKILYTYINYGGADGALQIQAYKRVASGTTNSGFATTEKPIKAGEFFKIRVEYILGKAEDCTKIYINDELLISGDYYSGTKGEGTSYTDTPHTSVDSAVILNYTAFVGNTYIDYSYLETGETPETTISFDKDYTGVITPTVTPNFVTTNTWKVEKVEDNNVLVVSKQGVDSPNYNGGLAFVINVTEKEKDAKIAVLEFDMFFSEVTNPTTNQFTMGHQGKRSNQTTPMLTSIKIEKDVKQHVIFFYEVTAAAADGTPTEIRYGYSINGAAPTTFTTPYKHSKSELAIYGGTLELPRIDQVENFTFALNNSFKGEGYFDNFRLALLKSFELPEAPVEPPHEHNYVDGKCECGATDPDYVAPNYNQTQSFDEMPATITFVATSTNAVIVADPLNAENKVLEVDTTFSEVTKSFNYAVTEIKPGAEVLVFETDILISEDAGITFEIFLTTKGYNSTRAKYATFNYFSGNSITVYQNGKGGPKTTVELTKGEWHNIRLEYRVSGEGSSKVPELTTYFDGNLVLASNGLYGTDYYSEDGVLNNALVPAVEDIDGVKINVSQSVKSGKYYFDDMFIHHLMEEDIEKPEAADGVFDFEDGELPEGFAISTYKDYIGEGLNNWAVVDQGENKVLFVDKNVKDTETGRYLGGVAFKYAPTKIEAGATVAIVSFDARFENIEGFDTQITLQHQGRGSDAKKITPFLVQLPKRVGEDLSIAIIYQPTEFDAAGIPTAMKYTVKINGEVYIESTDIYKDATYLNDGSVRLPLATQIDTITIALNNSFLGDAYLDNFRLELIKELPHEHEFVEGKCECGEVDPDYVAPHEHNYVDSKCTVCGEAEPGVLTFDEMPAASVFAVSSGNPGEAPYAQGENTWEIVTVEGSENKVLHISKNCNGKLVGVPNNNGTPDDTSDDFTEDKSSSNWGVNTKTYVTSKVDNANVAVYEAKILLDNITSNSGIQIRLYGNSTTAANCPAQFYFDTASGADGSEFRYSHSYNNKWDQDETLGNYKGKMGAYIGQWFTLRIEYRVIAADDAGTPTEIEYRTYVDGNLVWASGRVYGANIVAGTYALPKVSEISMMSLAFNNGYIGDFYLDNVSLKLNYEEPHEHEFVEGKCECGAEDPNYVAPEVHEHVYVEGKCECGAEDPNYVAPEVHEHVYVEGKCECGAEDPNYVAPEVHEHEFVEGKCECGAYDASFVTFDEMPAESVVTIACAGLTAEGLVGTNTWEIATVEEGKKALYINKGADGSIKQINNNGTPDDTSDDFEETITNKNSNCNVSITQYVT